MSKRANRIPTTPEQREALDKYQRDFTAAAPHIAELATAAQQMHKAIVDAPLWSIHETTKPVGAQPPQPWSVGHAKVNYVDKIETTNDEGTQHE